MNPIRLALLSISSLALGSLISVGFSSASFAATAPSPVIEPIVVEQTKSSVKISWQVPSDGGSPITDYVIEMRTTSPSMPWRVFSDGINSNNEATITGLTRGVVYQFRVTAKNGIGNSAATSVVKPRILATKVASADHSMCALNDLGEIYCWGSHLEIVVPYSSSHSYYTMYRKGNLAGFTDISGGKEHYCALHPQAGVMCWGRDFSSYRDRSNLQLFGGSSLENGVAVSFPTGVVPEKIFAGGTHSCVISTSKEAYCWGFNNRGQLGRGFTSMSEIVPGVVSELSQVSNLTLGAEFTCSAHVDGSVKCWGENGSGQLGRGTYTTLESFPATVSGLTSNGSIASGWSHTCAVSVNQTVLCWGSNGGGQVGEIPAFHLSNYSRPNPTVVSGLSGISSVSSGDEASCAISIQKTAYCWGINRQGQVELVNPGIAEGARPVAGPSAQKFEAIEMGNFHGCGILVNSTVYCWGVFEVASWVSLPTPKGVQGSTGIVLPITAPDKPLPLSITSRSSSTIGFTWTRPENGGTEITYNEIQCSTDGGSNWGNCSWSYEMYNRANSTGLQPGSTYVFRIRAGNNVGVSEYSDPSSPVLAASIPATMPVPTVVSKSETAISLSWNTPSSNGSALTDYVLEKSDDNGTTWLDTTNADSLSREASFSGLERGKAYLFRVRAINGEGPGIFSPVLGVVPSVAPSKIATLNVLTRASTSISLSWTAPDNGGLPITNYRVRQSSNNGATWQDSTLNRTGNTATQASVTNLTPGQTYIFQVFAESSEFTAPWSESSVAALAASTPAKPATLSLTSKSATSFAISWSEPSANGSAISDYAIEYSSNGGSTWTTLADDVSTVRTAEITGLTRGTTYLVKVSAINSEGTGLPSTSLSVIPAVKPLAPTDIVINSRTTTAISISWTAPDNGGRAVTGYYVQRSSDAGATWSSILLTPNDQAAFFNQSLSTGVTYYYRVAAKTPEVGNESAAVFSQMSSGALTATAPVVIVTPTLSSKSATSASIGWSIPSANGSALTGFTVEASTDSFATIATSQSYAPTVTAHTFAGLARGTVYQIRVKATNGEGTSNGSALTVIPAVKPAAPTDLLVTDRKVSEVSLAWTAPSDNGGRAITGYVVQRSLNLSTWTDVATLASTATSFRNTSLTSNVVHYYRVAALSAEAPGSSTAVFSLASQGARTSILPFAPSALTSVVQSGTSISLGWSSGGNPGAPVTDYVIESSQDSGSTWSTVSDGVDAYLSKTIAGLDQGSGYLFRVSALNLEGAGPATTLSAPIIPATSPSVALAPSVTSQSSNSIGISWEAPYSGGRDISGYTIQLSANSGATWTAASNISRASATALEATIGGLTQGSTYQFRIASTNAIGTSAFSIASSPAKAATTPGPVSNFRQTSNENNSLTVSWSSAFGNGSDITKYEIQYSRDGIDWTTVEAAGSANTRQITGLTTSAGYQLRVRAVNLQGVGAYVETEGATRGTTAQSILVTAANGEPITGGTLTWALNDGRARSSSGITLSSTGSARFSLVATGIATVTLTGGTLSSGANVDGSWQTTFGFGPIEFETATEPILTSRTLEVRMPNGVTVPDVSVGALSGFYSGTYVSNFYFSAPDPGTSGFTDKDGIVTLYGYAVGTPVAMITYDDSVLSQTTDVILAEQVTEVELPLMPWVSSPEVNKVIIAGEADVVLFTANAIPEVEIFGLGLDSQSEVNALESSASQMAFEAGVRVTVVPPLGAELAPYGCNQVLSALTDVNGVATLRICPSVSGEYKVVTAGAVASKPLIYNVLGRPAPAVIVPPISQGAAPGSAPVYNAPAQNPASQPLPISQPAMKLKQKTAGSSLATQIGMTVSPKAKVTLTVAKASKKFCKVSGGKLVALKPGNCSVTVAVTPAKTKAVKKPKAVKKSTVVVIS